MKEKILGAISIIAILILAIYFYPFIVETQDGDLKCKNILGQSVKCMNR